ncbi:hypothetical protein GC093_30825 [Paenibacillus sp. LMG 31456]|uniref:Uncharacterized protein n=1 Tax=Paenibacillus foliorum TaxID=2654974 RepID=A0A972GVU6_9BACL|nr:hypothetical protein [Paenibacillus foliorum]NOU97587.1 hypothetical protein [Paenibacillus foliorum]
MKLGSFLFGGLVGAAAVVYLNNKSKSMLFSALSSNQSVGNMMDKAKDRFNGASDSSATHGFEGKTNNKSASSTSSSNGFKKEDPFSTNSNSGLGKVEEIIKQDPKLNETVQEIIAQNNNGKETYQTQ